MQTGRKTGGMAEAADRYLAKIVDAVVDHPGLYTSRDALGDVASDTLDGNALAIEVRPLVRRGILTTHPLDDVEDRTLGNAVTWDLTGKGRDLVWAMAGLRRAERRAETFADWMSELRSDVACDSFGYECGEITFEPAAWRPLHARGLTPREAFMEMLAAFAASFLPSPGIGRRRVGDEALGDLIARSNAKEAFDPEVAAALADLRDERASRRRAVDSTTDAILDSILFQLRPGTRAAARGSIRDGVAAALGRRGRRKDSTEAA